MRSIGRLSEATSVLSEAQDSERKLCGSGRAKWISPFFTIISTSFVPTYDFPALMRRFGTEVIVWNSEML